MTDVAELIEWWSTTASTDCACARAAASLAEGDGEPPVGGSEPLLSRLTRRPA